MSEPTNEMSMQQAIFLLRTAAVFWAKQNPTDSNRPSVIAAIAKVDEYEASKWRSFFQENSK